jgi:hypothetical protein
MVGLCSSKDCGFIVVYGLDQNGSLRYGTAVSLLRNQFTGLSDWIETVRRNGITLLNQEVWAHLDETVLLVWSHAFLFTGLKS